MAHDEGALPVRLEATVHGVVQGVFFRFNTKRQADLLGVSGTVRNQPNGTVHVVAEGRREILEQLLSWLCHGPANATVDRVDVTWAQATGQHAGFRITG